MIIDSSGLVTIILREAGHEIVRQKLLSAPVVRISAGTLIEVRMIAAGRGFEPDLLRLLSTINIQVIPVDQHHVDLAIEGFRNFGRGRHRESLNFGDLFAYALARQHNEPLLFVGEDFSKTDVQVA